VRASRQQLDYATRARILELVTEFRRNRQPSPAALHEAGHEMVARHWRCRIDGVIVYPDGERGVIYMKAPATRVDDDGRLIRDPLGRLRAEAAVRMAGPAVEALDAGRPVAGPEELLLEEGGQAEVQAFWRESIEAFGIGSHRDALTWLDACLIGVRRQVIALLRENWASVVKRAHELDRKAAAA